MTSTVANDKNNQNVAEKKRNMQNNNFLTRPICPIQQVDDDGNVVHTYNRVQEINEAGYDSHRAITSARLFSTYKVQGYYWRFAGGDFERTSNKDGKC